MRAENSSAVCFQGLRTRIACRGRIFVRAERAVNSSGLISGVFRRVSGGRGRVPGALK